jgi:hypothetical protein
MPKTYEIPALLLVTACDEEHAQASAPGLISAAQRFNSSINLRLIEQQPEPQAAA